MRAYHHTILYKDVPGGAVSSWRGIRQADVHIEVRSDSGRGMRI